MWAEASMPTAGFRRPATPFLLFAIALLLVAPDGASGSFRFGSGRDGERSCRAADRVPEPFLPGATADAWRVNDDVLSTFWARSDGYGGEEGREYTYGEVTATGVRQLAEALLTESCGFSAAHGRPDRRALGADEDHVVFYDLG